MCVRPRLRACGALQLLSAAQQGLRGRRVGSAAEVRQRRRLLHRRLRQPGHGADPRGAAAHLAGGERADAGAQGGAFPGDLGLGAGHGGEAEGADAWEKRTDPYNCLYHHYELLIEAV